MSLPSFKPELLVQILDTPMRAMMLRAVCRALRELIDREIPQLTISLSSKGVKEVNCSQNFANAVKYLIRLISQASTKFFARFASGACGRNVQISSGHFCRLTTDFSRYTAEQSCQGGLAEHCPLIENLISAMVKGLRLQRLSLALKGRAAVVVADRLAHFLQDMQPECAIEQLSLRCEICGNDLICAARSLKVLANKLSLVLNLRCSPGQDFNLGNLAETIASLGPLNVMNTFHLAFSSLDAHTLFQSISACTTLHSLSMAAHISSTACASNTAAFLSDSLQSLTALRTLSLSLSTSPPHFTLPPSAISAALASFPHLHTLALSSTPLGPAGGAALGAALPSLSRTLTHLDLADTQLGREGVTGISAGLARCGALRHLSLDCNGVCPDAATALQHSLPALTALESLCLQSNALDGGGGTAIAAALHGAAAHDLNTYDLTSPSANRPEWTSHDLPSYGLTSLRLLDLSRNELGPAGGGAVLGALRGLTDALLGRGGGGGAGLTHLDLTDCLLGPAEAAAVAALLRGLTDMRHLGLGYNLLGPDGCACVVAAAAASALPLEWLDLTSCGLGPDGTARVAVELGRLGQLSELRLGGNQLGPAGGVALAPGLRSLTGLTRLDLGANGLGLAGGRAVVAALTGCQRLQQLQLGFIGADPAARRAVRAMVPWVKEVSCKATYQ